jgi:hypothetical protein
MPVSLIFTTSLFLILPNWSFPLSPSSSVAPRMCVTAPICADLWPGWPAPSRRYQALPPIEYAIAHRAHLRRSRETPLPLSVYFCLWGGGGRVDRLVKPTRSLSTLLFRAGDNAFGGLVVMSVAGTQPAAARGKTGTGTGQLVPAPNSQKKMAWGELSRCSSSHDDGVPLSL